MRRPLPKATVARLPLYLHCLESMSEGQPTVSSQVLAALANLNAAQVRKDLSRLGSYGVRGVGYDRSFLRFQIRRELGLERQSTIIIVGAGNLGSALANFGGFVESGFPVVGLYDIAAEKVGRAVDGLTVRHIDELGSDIAANGTEMAIITTPADVAQEVADRLIELGVRSILNFAPVVLKVPTEVEARQVDLSRELQILSYYLGRDSRAAEAG